MNYYTVDEVTLHALLRDHFELEDLYNFCCTNDSKDYVENDYDSMATEALKNFMKE